MENYKPISQPERIELLDTLRGMAIFGILMVNMPLFFKPFSQAMLGAQPDAGWLHIISESFIKFFFEGKFYALFSMLFGYGFYIFINKTAPEGKSIKPFYIRRVLFLMLFGALHVVLLWAGDILVFYGFLGLFLIAFTSVSNRGLIKWAFWLALIPTIVTAFSVLMMYLGSLVPEAKPMIDANIEQSLKVIKDIVNQANQIYSSGSYGQIIAIRLEEYKLFLPGVIFFYPMVLAMFLVGVWAARKKVIANYQEYLPLFRKIFWWGLAIGLIGNSAYAYSYQHTQMTVPNLWSLIGTFSHTLGGFSFSLLYVSIVVLLIAKGRLNWFSKNISPVGRMALTNYLSHSIICVFLFHPYGFGLFGRIEIWQGILITIAIYMVQIPFSRWWLNRFYFGPFEWLWRSLTYLKVQPFRKGNK